MSKSKDKQTPKPRGKYDEKLKVKGSFMDVMKVVVKEADKKYEKNTLSSPKIKSQNDK
jgi:hypothetical protein